MTGAVPALRIEMGPVGNLPAYASIPNGFTARSVLEVSADHRSFALQERALATPFSKDYDALESPLDWPRLFDVRQWAMASAFQGDRRVGGAIAAFDTPGLDMLQGRRDLVVLWDLRVLPELQGQGIGTQLFRAVQHWGTDRGGQELMVETQNVNVAACRFYASMGCKLLSAQAGAYADLPDETKLLWGLALKPPGELPSPGLTRP
ncbi:MAG TPA: GNAT family N-acetyltransferase [Ramlibacter sp.]|nr:GNAT family N-acetyltransferase [Ramlibacter sp.]